MLKSQMSLVMSLLISLLNGSRHI